MHDRLYPTGAAAHAAAARTPAAEDLAAEAVPLPEPAAPAAFPLPPSDLVEELDNQAPDKPAPVDVAAEDADAVTLDFIGDDLPYRDLALRFPFRWEGRVIDTVRVSQLTTADVGRISGAWSRSRTAPDYYDLYAMMTGLPAKVLRAMPSTDGEPLVAAAFDFLPPLFRPADG